MKVPRETHINKGRLQFQILHKMENCVPKPIIPQFTVCVVVTTPCCQKTLASVIVHVNGRRAGLTDASGKLRLALPVGQHKLSLPYQSSESQHKLVNVTSSAAREQAVELCISGALYFFLQKVGGKHAIKVTTNRYKVPVEASPFWGQAELLGPASSDRAAEDVPKDEAFPPMLYMKGCVACAEQLPCHVHPHSSLGEDYEPDNDNDEWYGKMHALGDCSVALLFSVQQPMTLGYLHGVKPVTDIPLVLSTPAPPLSPPRAVTAIPLRVRSQSSPRPATAGLPPASPSRMPPQRIVAVVPRPVAEDRQQDVAVRLVEVMKRTLDTRLRDMKQRLDCVETDHQHLEDQLQHRLSKGRRRPARSPAHCSPIPHRTGVRGRGRRSNSVA